MVLPRSTKVAALSALFAIPLAIACSASTSGEGSVPDPVAGQDEAIINGSKDTGHPAVVFLQLTIAATATTPVSFAGCTGTIIQTDPATKIGYVLTAGHCIRNTTAVQVIAGNELTASTGISSFVAIDFKAHPQYDGQVSSPFDVAMIRIGGVDANTPVIPLLSPDNMVAGQTRVDSIGFGQTEHPGSVAAADAGMNTAKNHITGTVSRMSAQQMAVTYDNGGDICHGDSGGPVLTTVGGKEFVAGVHSFGSGPCVGDAVSIRASAHVSFYQSIMSQAAPAQTCDLCRKESLSGTSVCATKRNECLADSDCGGFTQCLNTCARTAAHAPAGTDAGTADCQKACVAQFPYGIGPYQNLVGYCSCNACDSACSTDTACAAVPKCGVKYADATCNSCMEGACCAQESACGADGHCSFCLKNPTAAECATNAAFQAIKSCKATSCATECPAPPPASP